MLGRSTKSSQQIQCATHNSYGTRDETIRTFNSYIEKQSYVTVSSMSSTTSATCSSGSTAQKLNQSENLMKLNYL